MKFNPGELLEYVFAPKQPTIPARPLTNFSNTSYVGQSGRFIERLLDRPKDQSGELFNYYRGSTEQKQSSLDPRAFEGPSAIAGINRFNTLYRNPRTIYLAPNQMIGAYQPFAGKEHMFIPRHREIK